MLIYNVSNNCLDENNLYLPYILYVNIVLIRNERAHYVTSRLFSQFKIKIKFLEVFGVDVNGFGL